MDKQIPISVLMPVYNAEKYVKTAIESILQQTYSDFELLITDDGSKDDSLKIIKDYANRDNRIRYIHRENKGLPATLNEMLQMARGKYLARMDADDYSYPDRFEKQFSYMEAHPDIDILGATIRIMGSRAKFFLKQDITPAVRAARMLFVNGGIAHPTAFIRKSFLDDHHLKYDERYGAEDYHLWVEFVICGGIIDQLDETLLDYRLSETQISRRMADKTQIWCAQAQKKMLNAIGDFTEEEQKLLSEWSTDMLSFDADAHIEFLQKVFLENHKTGLLDEIVLRREAEYQYAIRAFMLFKHTRNTSLLKAIRQAVVEEDRKLIARKTANYIYQTQKYKLLLKMR